ncbi:MAG: acyltransferase [bacterium]
MEEKRKKARIASIDSMRVLAIMSVVYLHSISLNIFDYQEGLPRLLVIITNQSARFAVPFFFLAAGYFFGKKVQSGIKVRQLFIQYTKRLLNILGFWSIIYFFIPISIQELSHKGLSGILHSRAYFWIVEHPGKLLLEGTYDHLWFLISLIMALGILTVMISYGLDKAILWVSLFLYVFGLLGGPYALTPLGFHFPFNTRNGPFFSTIFLAVGWWLSQNNKLSVKVSTACIISTAGFLLHTTEVFLLYNIYGISPMCHDNLIGTPLFGIGVMLFVLAQQDFLQSLNLPALGRYTLGVYVTHILFIFLFKPLKPLFSGAVWIVLYPSVTFICSLLLTILMSKNQYLKKVVM